MDSVFLQDMKSGIRTDTVKVNEWYDLYFFASDEEGFKNLSYNHITFNSTEQQECDAISKCGTYDPRTHYFISLSRGINDEKAVFIRNRQTQASVRVQPGDQSYINGKTDYFVINDKKQYWKTTVRI